MTEIAFCFIIIIATSLRPATIPYLLLLYVFATGFGGQALIGNLKVAVGSVNVFALDLLYATACIFFIIFFIKKISNAKFKRSNSSVTNNMATLILLYILFFTGKLINGFFNHVAPDSLVRMFMQDTHVFYFFIPLIIYKDTQQIGRLLRFTVILALIFPLGQPFLANSDDTKWLMHAQGTFRLGFGDTNVLLATGAIALLCWEKKRYLAFLPLAGIMMLAHRSGYIAIFLSFIALSYFKGQKLQTIGLMSIAGALVIGLLATLQSFTSVNILDQNLSRAGETFKATGTTLARASVMTIALEEFQERPLTGLSYLEIQSAKQQSEFSPRDFNIVHPHNFVLSAIMNTGLIGTLLLFSLLTITLSTSYKLARDQTYKIEGTFLFSTILFFVIYALMNTTMGSAGYVLWFLCGITFRIYNIYDTSIGSINTVSFNRLNNRSTSFSIKPNRLLEIAKANQQV